MSYRIRPEWAPQRGVFLVWPHAESDWVKSLPLIQAWYTEFVAKVAPTEEVYLICHNPETEQECRRCLESIDVPASQVHYLVIPSNDTWVRDFGPLSLHDDNADNEIAWANFRFNAWGGKYDYTLDNQATERLSQFPVAPPTLAFDWILEGGAIDVNEDGVLITTANCVLNPNRNPFERQVLEQRLRADLGVEQILILESGFLQGDDTDSHVDNLVRFSNNQTLLYCSCNDSKDPHYESLHAMQQQLQTWNQTQASPFALIPIPLPEPVYNADGERLAASYLNFLILNHVVVVPSYHDNDSEKSVIRLFEDLFPHRAIVTIDSRNLVAQGGGPHCASMQFS